MADWNDRWGCWEFPAKPHHEELPDLISECRSIAAGAHAFYAHELTDAAWMQSTKYEIQLEEKDTKVFLYSRRDGINSLNHYEALLQAQEEIENGYS